MKILITGARGQLGHELQRQLREGGSALGPLPAALHGAEVVSVDLDDADLSQLRAAQELLAAHRPDAVINCAAFTNVDACESDPDAAFRANAVLARNLAIACEAISAKLAHISTDYVLPGDGQGEASEAAPTGPRSVYGETKLLGEAYVKTFCSRWFTLRTAWLYGAHGGNFVKTILRLARDTGELRVVDDQLGNPTNAEDLAHHILKLLDTDQYGLYHCTGNGVCSWYDFACEIVRFSGLAASVVPVSTEEFPRPAARPARSALSNAMLRATVGDDMREWQTALSAFMSEHSLEALLDG